MHTGPHEVEEVACCDLKVKHLPYGCVEAGQEAGQGFPAIRVRQQTHDDDLLLCSN